MIWMTGGTSISSSSSKNLKPGWDLKVFELIWVFGQLNNRETKADIKLHGIYNDLCVGDYM